MHGLIEKLHPISGQSLVAVAGYWSLVTGGASVSSLPSNIKYPVSCVLHPASSIRPKASSIQHPATGLRYPLSGIAKLVDLRRRTLQGLRLPSLPSFCRGKPVSLPQEDKIRGKSVRHNCERILPGQGQRFILPRFSCRFSFLVDCRSPWISTTRQNDRWLILLSNFRLRRREGVK